MSGSRVKETMEQIHISEEMQEQIILNVENRMKSKKKTMEKCGKLAAAAAIVLVVGIVGIPVQACIRSFVMARMEEIPREEVTDIARMVQEQSAEADSFSREYSDSEKERMTRLLQSYRDGIFPEKTILLVEHEEEMPEGILCYVIEAGYFNLPECELTDEELLQIIDFNKMRNYALAQSPAGQEARREYLAAQEKLRERVEEESGISREEAVEIAVARMESQLGEQAKGMEYVYMRLYDMAETGDTDEQHVIYVVVLHGSSDLSPYVCMIDSTDGCILESGVGLPYSRNILDE